MSTTFPTTLDSLSNPTGTTETLNPTPELGHAKQHENVNDAIEALQAKVGVNDSAVTTSHDYKIKNGGAIRKTAQVTTDSIAANASDSAKTLALGKACLAIKIETDYPAWVRVYSSAAAQSADASRLIADDPTGEHGVLLEVLTTSTNLVLNLAPAAACFSLESSPGTTLPITVTNKDTVSRAITATVTFVPMEG